MIALEWDVGCLRQRGIPFDDMAREEQLTVLTHYYKRTSAPTFDATTSEAATPLDLIHIQRALTTKPKPAEDDGKAQRDLRQRLEADRDAAAARAPRGD